MYQSRTKRGNIGPSGKIADRERKYRAEKRNNKQRRQILDRDEKYWVARGNTRQRREILDREGKYGTEWGILDSEENIGQCGKI